MNTKLRMGMIGGGQGAFIGAIHRTAAAMDGLIELCCGAFSASPEKSITSGRKLMLPEKRIYASYEEMIHQEKELAPEERMHFVSIVTPNHAHFAPAMLALSHGFHVVIEKPMTFTLEEAKALKQKVQETGCILCVTHTYAGYPIIKQARQLISDGALGTIRKVYVEYTQGWLSQLSEKEGNSQAAWRTNPQMSGKAGAMGDIGTHAAHLAEYVSGLQISKICADINIVVPGRQLDDDGAALLKFNNGASGVLVASQVAAGDNNSLSLKIYGEHGGIEWQQETPNTLKVKWSNQPEQIYHAGSSYISPMAKHNSRTPAGHPEGYIEAFANIYQNFAQTLIAKIKKQTPTHEMLDFPTVEDGVRGMAFIDNVIESGKSATKWVDFKI